MPRVSGRERVIRRLEGMAGQKAVEKVGQALFVAGDIIRAEAKHSITEGSISGKGHIPSKPGEAPNADTHHLDTNIETTQPAPLRVEVSSNAKYAVALEAGTSRMAARPYMGPASRRKKKEVIATVRRAISEAIKEA